jgi:hypothetical protein
VVGLWASHDLAFEEKVEIFFFNEEKIGMKAAIYE